jgi:sugar phosphate isomerase/epimerase
LIGVSCPGFCAADPEETWEAVSKHFGHWEIFSEARHSVDLWSERFLEARGGYDMTYSVHAPICDVNIASLSDRLREAAILEMFVAMDHAAAMGARTVTVHPGLRSFAVEGVEARSAELARLSLKTISRAAAQYGVAVAVENMPQVPVMLGRTPEELGALVDGTDVGICFDIGHANTAGCIDGFLDAFGDRIANVHIHDNDGDRDAHLAIGEGSIDFAKALSRLKGYSGDYIIESRSLESAIRSKAALEKLLG